MEEAAKISKMPFTMSCSNPNSSSDQLFIPKRLLSKYKQALATPITDGANWAMKPEDAYFSNISPSDIMNWRSRLSPLSLSNKQWSNFTRKLFNNLEKDGFGEIYDIRLNGSLARMFSNPTKPSLATAQEAIDWYEEEYDSKPSNQKCQDIADNFNKWLGPVEQRQNSDVPRWRFVDLFYNLGLASERSDIDIQISSDFLGDAITNACSENGINGQDCKHRFGFYDREMTEKILPHTAKLMNKWTNKDGIGIDFTFVVFDSEGPQNSIAHFRDDDWLIGRPCEGGDFCEVPNWYTEDWKG